MKRLRYFFILFLATSYYFLATTHTLAAPPAPFSEVGNPSDTYQLESMFPLLRFIQPKALVVFENEDYSRNYQDKCTEVSTFTGSCTSSSECVAVRSCGGVKRNFSGTCNIPANSTSGTCSYPQKNPTIAIDPKGTDFSRDSSAPHDPEDMDYFLTFPKYQNEALRYQNPGGENPLSWGAHNLTLDSCEQAARKLMVAYQAAETKKTVEGSKGEWPLGWVDWGYQTSYNNLTILEIWNRYLAGSFSNIAHELVLNQYTFFYSLGQGTRVPASSDTTARRELCRRISSATTSEPWYQALAALPLYPPSYRSSYVRTSICVYNSCSPGANSGDGQSLYADTSIHPAYAAAIYDYLQAYPLSVSLSYLDKLAEENPLIRFSLNSSPAAIPSRLERTLKAYGPKDFTFGSLGYVYDYLNDKKINSYGYTLQPEDFSQEEAGAFTESLSSKIINFAYGIVDSFAPVTNHLITIPEPLGQLIYKIQEPVYESRDTLSNLKDDAYQTMSNIADGGSKLLFAGKGLAAGDARRRMAYFTCKDSYYSSPSETSVLDYATGARNGCYADSITPTTGKCDPAAFTKLLNAGGYDMPTQPLSKAVTVFSMYKDRLTEEQLNIYGAASAATGVPCEVLAGIHYVEGLLDPQKSLVSGRPLGTPEPDAGNQVFKTLLDTAIYAGNHLKGKVGGNIKDIRALITALSRYNGGGNSQCQPDYGYPIPYSGTCPPLFEGEDDLYPMSWLDDKHSSMYLLYCDDHLACEPAPYEAPGSLTFALMTHNYLLEQVGGQP